MKNIKVVMLIATCLITGCYHVKKIEIEKNENTKEIVIKKSILDFTSRCSIFKKDSVFMISYIDSLYSLVLKKNENNTYRWIKDIYYQDYVAVTIGSSDYQFYYSEKHKHLLPSRYMVVNNKLFFWWDDNYPVSDEIISVLRKYNLLQEEFIIPDFTRDDSKKGAHYYFCKNNIERYKRIITNIAIGYYKPPKCKCVSK